MKNHLPQTILITIPSAFSSDVYSENMQEASFLYEQRGMLFKDPEVSWLDIGEFEDRSEAHIDALVVGGDEALFVCQERVLDGDPGELHAAVRVYCRQKRMDLIQEVLNALDTEDPERVLAVRNALKLEWPQEWHVELERMLKEMPDKSVAVMPAVAGYKRIPAEGALLYVLPICPYIFLFPEIKSIGRINARNARHDLMQHLHDENPSICSVTAMSLLRMGINPIDAIPSSSDKLTFCQIMTLALAGGKADVMVLIEHLSNPASSVDHAFALGVLGDPMAMEQLISCLQVRKEAEAVAIALNLITGADLYEKTFIPDDIDVDELFEDERERFEKGEPVYPPGEEPGITITQLTTDPGTWVSWWQQNRTRFQTGVRYRNGVPYHPRCLLDNLRSEESPVLVRQIAYEELVVRYGIDVPFETDMLVKDQLHALSRMAERIESEGERFEEGKWYFAGHESQTRLA